MDALDRRILFEVAENARESHSVLARKLRVSRETFDYRLKKLKKEGIVINSQARINISNFIYGAYILLIRCHGLTGQTEAAILEKMNKNRSTHFIGKIGGSYDYIIGFTVKRLTQLGEYVDFINEIVGKYKTRTCFLTIIEEIKDSYKSIFGKTNETIVSMPLVKDTTEIDDIDRKILVELGRDCTVPSWKISEATRITDVAIRKRIKKLMNQKVILGFRTMVDLTKIGYQLHYLFIKTLPENLAAEKNFKTHLKSDQFVSFATKVTGEYDYVICHLSKDNRELNDQIGKLRENFSNVVTEVSAMPLFEIVYWSQLAEEDIQP
jgi:DNA-binding Lrp family transcriptional regulator